MRIVAGKLGGRKFNSPNGPYTHPMSDKVRGALFNMLGDLDGYEVLDAFSGSGALSFEALSRGAAHVTAIEIEKQAHETIAANARALGIVDSLKVIRANAATWSDNNPGAVFDLVLCDPPYDKLQLGLVEKLTHHLSAGALLVLSCPGKLKPPVFGGLEQVANKQYGEAQLVFYRKQ